MSAITEFFGYYTKDKKVNWKKVVKDQFSRYTKKKSIKVRKSQPEIAIGTVVIKYGKEQHFGINWKMTAKTTLVQLHHKIMTFEHLNKKFVLVLQDDLLNYMTKEFNFDHLNNPAILGDSMYFHSYKLLENGEGTYLELGSRISTDGIGLAKSLGLRAEAQIELEIIVKKLESRISKETLFNPVKS